MEAAAIGRSARPGTAATLAADLRALGVPTDRPVLVHTAMSRLGWVAGAAQGVLDGLSAALGPGGTLVMPTHTSHLSDPATWGNPPVPESWWDEVRAGMPAYDPQATPSRMMGAVPECFRACAGVLRSAHPQVSFAARGPLARHLLDPHPLDFGLGEGSPLSRLYDAAGSVLLLGVGHDRSTVLHLAEHRSGRAAVVDGSAPVAGRGWTTFRDLDWDPTDFPRAGAAYRAAEGPLRSGRVGLADALLLPVVPLVDFATDWLERNRRPRATDPRPRP